MSVSARSNARCACGDAVVIGYACDPRWKRPPSSKSAGGAARGGGARSRSAGGIAERGAGSPAQPASAKRRHAVVPVGMERMARSPPGVVQAIVSRGRGRCQVALPPAARAAPVCAGRLPGHPRPAPSRRSPGWWSPRGPSSLALGRARSRERGPTSSRKTVHRSAPAAPPREPRGACHGTRGGASRGRWPRPPGGPPANDPRSSIWTTGLPGGGLPRAPTTREASSRTGARVAPRYFPPAAGIFRSAASMKSLTTSSSSRSRAATRTRAAPGSPLRPIPAAA